MCYNFLIVLFRKLLVFLFYLKKNNIKEFIINFFLGLIFLGIILFILNQKDNQFNLINTYIIKIIWLFFFFKNILLVRDNYSKYLNITFYDWFLLNNLSIYNNYFFINIINLCIKNFIFDIIFIIFIAFINFNLFKYFFLFLISIILLMPLKIILYTLYSYFFKKNDSAIIILILLPLILLILKWYDILEIDNLNFNIIYFLFLILFLIVFSINIFFIKKLVSIIIRK